MSVIEPFFHLLNSLAKFNQNWWPNLCRSRRHAHRLIVSLVRPCKHPPSRSPVSYGTLTTEPTIYVHGDLAEFIKSFRPAGRISAGRLSSLDIPGTFHRNSLLGIGWGNFFLGVCLREYTPGQSVDDIRWSFSCSAKSQPSAAWSGSETNTKRKCKNSSTSTQQRNFLTPVSTKF